MDTLLVDGHDVIVIFTLFLRLLISTLEHSKIFKSEESSLIYWNLVNDVSNCFLSTSSINEKVNRGANLNRPASTYLINCIVNLKF